MRLFRLTRFFPGLQVLVFSIVNTLKSLVWAVVLLALIFYTFGIYFTLAVKDHLDDYKDDIDPDVKDLLNVHYGTLGLAMDTLFKSISGGVSWQEVANPLQTVQVCYGFFIFFIVFTIFAVLNVITGVFVQSASEAAEEDQDMAFHNYIFRRQAYISRMRELFSQTDVNMDGGLTIDEFADLLTSDMGQAFLGGMDLTMSEAQIVFNIFDTDGGGHIDLEEFLTGCLRMRGAARSIDMLMMMSEMKALSKNLELTTYGLETAMSEIYKVQLQGKKLQENVRDLLVRPSVHPSAMTSDTTMKKQPSNIGKLPPVVEIDMKDSERSTDPEDPVPREETVELAHPSFTRDLRGGRGFAPGSW